MPTIVYHRHRVVLLSTPLNRPQPSPISLARPILLTAPSTTVHPPQIVMPPSSATGAAMLVDTMNALSLEDIREQPLRFLRMSIISIKPETTNIHVYRDDVASFFHIKCDAEFKSALEPVDFGLTASSVARTFTLKTHNDIFLIGLKLFNPSGKLAVPCEDGAIIVLDATEIAAASSHTKTADADSIYWVHIVLAPNEGTPHASLVRQIAPKLIRLGLTDPKFIDMKSKGFGQSIGKLHVAFRPHPDHGINVRGMNEARFIGLDSGSQCEINFTKNEPLQRELGLCGQCLHQRCRCASSSGAGGGKRAQETRDAYAKRRRASVLARK